MHCTVYCCESTDAETTQKPTYNCKLLQLWIKKRACALRLSGMPLKIKSQYTVHLSPYISQKPFRNVMTGQKNNDFEMTNYLKYSVQSMMLLYCDEPFTTTRQQLYHINSSCPLASLGRIKSCSKKADTSNVRK